MTHFSQRIPHKMLKDPKRLFLLTRNSCSTIFVDMKNMTITLREETARWARVWAAEHNTSVSRLVGELLQQKMEQEQAYAAAKQQYLAGAPHVLKTAGGYPGRDALHER